MHASTMRDRDQSRCNRSVKRPRTRPPGDHHQMLDVGCSRAEETITGPRSRRSATRLAGGARDGEPRGNVGGPSGTTPEDPGTSERSSHSEKPEFGLLQREALARKHGLF